MNGPTCQQTEAPSSGYRVGTPFRVTPGTSGGGAYGSPRGWSGKRSQRGPGCGVVAPAPWFRTPRAVFCAFSSVSSAPPPHAPPLPRGKQEE